MEAMASLSQDVGVQKACGALGVARASFYRWSEPPLEDATKTEPVIPSWSLFAEERQRVLDLLHTDRFVDQSPREVYATMLDEGTYLCSVRSMYRILEEQGEVRERRNQLCRPTYQKPELLARGPNQVWSWDITKLKGPVKWTYYYLYVLLDIFSRYAAGWMVAHREQASLAQKLIEESCEKQSIKPGHLMIHSDRGPSMSSKPVALLLADLGVTKSHSRPHVSNDNPYCESQFKTLKYRPEFPKRFGATPNSSWKCLISLDTFRPLSIRTVKDMILTNISTFGRQPKGYRVGGNVSTGEIPVALRAPSISPGPLTSFLPRRGHFYFGSNRTFLLWLDILVCH